MDFVITHSLIDSFLMTIIPLFVVIDPLGNIPFVIALSEGMSRSEHRKLTYLATAAAGILGLFFLVLGQFVLKVLSISVSAFAVAGGLILLVLSIHHMSTGRLVESTKEDLLAIVPIGTPITVGPAAITTLILLATQFPLYIVMVSFLLNMVLVFISLLLTDQIIRIMGKAGIKIFSRVAALLLAAIAVNMIIHGLQLAGILHA
jgi:multiple antibiotic resistance protein